MSSENVTLRICNNFSIIQSHYSFKMCFNNPVIIMEPVLPVMFSADQHAGHVQRCFTMHKLQYCNLTSYRTHYVTLLR